MCNDISSIRKDFPVFQNRPDLIYLDNAATTQKPFCVIQKEQGFYEKNNANPFRGIYKLGEDVTEEYENARITVQKFIHAEMPEEIIFTRNATESLNLVAYSLSALMLKPGDEILISIMEHHSNLIPWQQAAARTGAVLKYIECTKENPSITENQLRNAITSRTKIVAITQTSNVLGCTNDIRKLAKTAHEKGAVFVADGAFEGDGCAISQASTDMMLDLIIGKSTEEALNLAEIFLRMIKGQITSEEKDQLEKAGILEDISHMPSRVKCAVLGWHTMEEMLKKA